MASRKVHVLSGHEPGPHLTAMLCERESCFARFEQDPWRRVWVCSRLENTIYAAPLRRDHEWVSY